MSFDVFTCCCRASQRLADWEQEEMHLSAASHQGRYGSDRINPPLLPPTPLPSSLPFTPQSVMLCKNMLLTADVAVFLILVLWHL